jgi:signal transduction histidine kinase
MLQGWFILLVSLAYIGLLFAIAYYGDKRAGALVGLSAGFVVWSYTLPLPSLVDSGYLPQRFIELGPFGLNWLRPYALFGLEGLNPITHAMLWSMLVNAGGYIIVSLLSQQSVSERSQATLFVDIFKYSGEGDRARFWRDSASVAALRSLLGRFLGRQRVEEAFAHYARQRALNWSQAPDADAELVDFAEKLLAGAIGAASARVMVASVVKEEPLSLEEVMDILDETSQVIAYSHQLEQKSRELEAATAELRAANEQLKELDRLKDDFISTVTHELRTPLTSIRAFSEILCDHPHLDETRQSQFLTIILKESERLTRLINQVLDLSKIESGQMVWSLSEIDLTEVIKEALTATGQLFQEKNIQVELDLPERMPRLVADRDRIMQVLLNLLSNAMKFCNNQAGWVAIRLPVKNGFAQVDVSDNGPGIRPKDQEVIFEKFRQVGDTLTEKPQGTGLGLPICRHIITHFDGKLWVKSEPGHGATFSFTLPLQPQPLGSEIVETNGRSRLLTTIKSLRSLTSK